jgi:hypothetical protein
LGALRNEPGLQLDYDPQRVSILVSREGEAVSRLGDLPEVEQQLVLECLQLSLVRFLSQQEVRLPLVLQHDLLCTVPADVARRTASLLRELAVQGQQILLITHRTSVADLFQELGMPTLVVSRMATPSKSMPRSAHRSAGAAVW